MKLRLPQVQPTSVQVQEPEIVEKAKELVKTEEGLAELETILRKNFTPARIKKLISDLCEAEDTKMTASGDSYSTPNWDARKNGLDRLLQLLRFTGKDSTQTRVQPTRIVVNIVGDQKVNLEHKDA